MLYIEYNFYWWLADVGPTLARRSKSRWPNVGSQRRTDGCADVGPTSVRRRNAIWDEALNREDHLTVTEIGAALKGMKHNKTSGINSFPAEFEKYFGQN